MEALNLDGDYRTGRLFFITDNILLMIVWKFRDVRHRFTVTRRRVGVVAALNGFCLGTEMLPNEFNLKLAPRFLNDNTLNSARVRRPDDIRRLAEIEGTDVLPHLITTLLFGRRWCGRDTRRRGNRPDGRSYTTHS